MYLFSVFILCWSPYIIFDMLQVYELVPTNETVAIIATFIQSLAPLNSAANPLIYFMFSANFSKYFRCRVIIIQNISSLSLFRNSRLRRWLCCCVGADDPLYHSTANTSCTSNLRTTSTSMSTSTGGYSKHHR